MSSLPGLQPPTLFSRGVGKKLGVTGAGTGPYCGIACERHLSLGLFGDEVGKLTIAGSPFGGNGTLT